MYPLDEPDDEWPMARRTHCDCGHLLPDTATVQGKVTYWVAEHVVVATGEHDFDETVNYRPATWQERNAGLAEPYVTLPVWQCNACGESYDGDEMWVEEQSVDSVTQSK